MDFQIFPAVGGWLVYLIFIDGVTLLMSEAIRSREPYQTGQLASGISSILPG